MSNFDKVYQSIVNPDSLELINEKTEEEEEREGAPPFTTAQKKILLKAMKTEWVSNVSNELIDQVLSDISEVESIDLDAANTFLKKISKQVAKAIK